MLLLKTTTEGQTFPPLMLTASVTSGVAESSKIGAFPTIKLVWVKALDDTTQSVVGVTIRSAEVTHSPSPLPMVPPSIINAP